MFSTPMRAVFYILAQAFMKLYKLPADWQPTDEHEEFTGADMGVRVTVIDPDDNPATGTGPDAPPIVNTPGVVFGDPAATFTQPVITGQGVDTMINYETINHVIDTSATPITITLPPATHTPVYQMTEKAEGLTREQYHASKWTDELLLQHGMMVDVSPKPAPSTAVAPQPPIAPAPPLATSAPQPPVASQPAASPVAPVAPVAPTAAAPAVLVDSTGLPWDERIHSSARTMTEKGVWKKRKNVADSLVAQVTAELRQRVPAPAASAAPFAQPQAPLAPVAPPVAVAPPAPAVVPPVPVAGNPAAQAAMAQAMALAAVAKSGMSAPGTFGELMQWVANNNLAPMMSVVSAKLQIAGLGLLDQPTHQHMLPEAFGHFLILKGG